jgi:hypothetical protein
MLTLYYITGLGALGLYVYCIVGVVYFQIGGHVCHPTGEIVK